MKPVFVKTLIAIAAISLIVWLLTSNESSNDNNSLERPITKVSVVEITPVSDQLDIHVTGLVKPRWQVDLISTVSGRLIDQVDAIVPGSFVSKDQVMARIEEIDYAASLANAASSVAEAKLNLARIVNEQNVAKHLENGTQQNDFRLFKPHVTAARAQLKAAEAGYMSAQKNLKDTHIRSPFDAIVLAKNIAPYQQVNAGDHIYSIASSEAIDVEVNLSAHQWQQVVINNAVSASIIDSNDSLWPADVHYLSPTLNKQTRQRQMMLTLNDPYKEVNLFYPDQQVKVRFASKEFKHMVKAPATALTRDNRIWTVENSLLKLEKIRLLNETHHNVTFQFAHQPEKSRQVVIYPLSSMIEGQAVKAMLTDSVELEQ